MHLSSFPVRRLRIALPVVALVAAGLWRAAPAAAQEQQAQSEPPRLAPSPQLREAWPPSLRRELPTFVEGARITGRTDLDTAIEGEAMLRRGDTVIRADRIDYYQPDDRARASGNVRINRAGNTYEGPLLEMRIDAFEGFFNEPRYRFLKNDAYGQASRIDFLDDQRAVIRDATYTTCRRQPDASWLPEWQLTAESIRIDNEEEVGYATGAVLRFYGVPLLPVPYLSFPLADKRKSGLLPPTFGVDNVSGVIVTQPYYWNIAPNRDATFSPTAMTKRGIDLTGEFRYLEPGYSGTVRASFLPADPLRDRNRWSFGVRHTDRLLTAQLPPGVSLRLDLNRVSDNDYWRDFTSREAPTLTNRLLPSEGALAWSQGPWSLQARALKWQTLQDTTATIVPPYDRTPQLVARYTASALPAGLAARLEADHTYFRSTQALTGQPNGRRTFLSAQLSQPWRTPGVFLVPRLQLHARHYQFDSALATGEASASLAIPTVSVDSGLMFEREIRWFDRDLTQTLEPRAFFVYTPFRAQTHLPNYDSGANDFSFATLFTESAFGGHDRIADNNLLTLGVTSRLQDAATGAEVARVGVAQRLRFSEQRVTLKPGDPPGGTGLSDLLVGGAINWTRDWSTDATVQYNIDSRRSVRSTISARYSPSPYRVVSSAYRLQRGQSEQIDIGWQWPINDLWGDRGEDLGPGRGQGGNRWYSVGRLNLSLRERRVVDAIIGVEYDGCCWIGRAVLERQQTGVSKANVRLLFQLEFVGFVRLGTNALGSLKSNIPRYQFLREQVAAPSRFTQYD